MTVRLASAVQYNKQQGTGALLTTDLLKGFRDRGSHIHEVLQSLWCGGIAGREALVVLQGVRSSQQLLYLLARVSEGTSYGAELLQRNPVVMESMLFTRVSNGHI